MAKITNKQKNNNINSDSYFEQSESEFRAFEDMEYDFENLATDYEALKYLQNEARAAGLMALAALETKNEKAKWSEYYNAKYKFIGEYKRARLNEPEELYPRLHFDQGSIFVENMDNMSYEEIVENMEYIRSVLVAEGYRSFEIQYHTSGEHTDSHIQIKSKEKDFKDILNRIKIMAIENKWTFKTLSIKEQVVIEDKPEIIKKDNIIDKIDNKLDNIKGKIITIDDILKKITSSSSRVEEIKNTNKKTNETLDEIKNRINRKINVIIHRNEPKRSALDKAKTLLARKK